MASDAKIGLLLGLVFIFIIALIINGLPTFNDSSDSNELTNNMVSSQNKSPAIAAKQRQLINRTAPVVRKPAPADATVVDNEETRVAVAPKNSLVVVMEQTPVEKAITAAAAQAVAAKDESRGTSMTEPAPSKTYVVGSGDTLAKIARKVYGTSEGNRKINITRIFDANRKLLKSPDEIFVGQKLVIPPLQAQASDKGKTPDIFNEKSFVKVDSIGSRHLLTNTHRPEQDNWHIVQRGDSLWQIAADQLGDGRRSSEIARLNAAVLDDDDSLSVGMRLKMPMH
jgi:nucleoid-associated protein YgaU